MNASFSIGEGKGMADALMRWISQDCERVEVVGQVRREVRTVTRIDVLYVPKIVTLEHRHSSFFTERFNQVERIFRLMLELQVVRHRKVFEQGPSRVLTHPAGVAAFETVLFSLAVNYIETTHDLWPHALAFHTGPMVFNNQMASRAASLGMIWKPDDAGLIFRNGGGQIPVQSERQLLDALRMDWVEPKGRG